ncbi:hypothetical protein ACFQ34_04930 [Pseudonocardia benzenivorans]|jgi:hypothetical protein|uniref:DUF308 domain-containing protein n=2 Tax=Pseudonocardia TaxID=1847 RepID=F4CL44_PSEUX|nr:hypothetical protein [Pseudonocardia dioxanivorans]AEA24973.1 hypothetical protein Psed_2773 [Pseudonocardia dioxanivorans CB1190]GJF05669.1 hypothetical protein PSD17_46190 [Pseudonocardia sp. D17]
MNHDPDDRWGPGTGDRDRDPDLDEFDRIVAAWRDEGSVPQWPTAAEPAEPLSDDAAPGDPASPLGRPASASGDETSTPAVGIPETARDDLADPLDEHFVPPEPPPLPRLGPPAIVGIVLLGLGLLLVVAPSVLGMSSVYGLPLGLLSLAAGLGWLVLRLWPTPADDEDPDDDDGAVL